MSDISFGDISEFLNLPRRFDAALLGKIKTFVESLGYEHVVTRSEEFSNSGSAMFVELFLAADGERSTLDPQPMSCWPIHLKLAISSRGPLITSCGYEWRSENFSESRQQGADLGSYRCGAHADIKAKKLALRVGNSFRLTYLDREWLRGFNLDEQGLSNDALLSVDFSEPDALNVLFTEFI